MEKTIREFLSGSRTTERARFDFRVPDTVEDHLTACYRDVVERFGCTFSPTPDTRRVLKSAAQWFRTGKPGLLLTGTVGTGKSKLLMAIRTLIAYYTDNRDNMKIFSAPAICELPLSKDDDDATTFARLRTYLYLGIDDLGAEPVTVKSWGTELSPVIDVLYRRYDERMVTIITTNDSIEPTLKNKYGDRIYDRLCEQYDIIVFNFKSFRQLKNK
jgi:DNA replication protein DnaC